eukprot:SAG22_NODE_4346_length_1296_cov_1.384294_1_plen_128_part_10
MPVASTLEPDRTVDKLNPGSPPRLRHTQEEVGEWPTGQVNWASSLRNPLWQDPTSSRNDKYIGSNPNNPNVNEVVRPGTASTRRAFSPEFRSHSRPNSAGTKEATNMRVDAGGSKAFLLPDAYARDTF